MKVHLLIYRKTALVIFAIAFLTGDLLCMDSVYAEDFNTVSGQPSKKSTQHHIEVFVQKENNSDFASFKGSAIYNTTLDAILAVLLDSNSYVDWVYQCKESFLIDKKSFNERYYYQAIDIPFPFDDRDVVIYSKLHHDPLTDDIDISLFADADYCKNDSTGTCKKIKPSGFVRIKDIVGSFRLQKTDQGIKVTWIQHTDPGGNLPSWLVNQYVVETPYQTLLNLADKLNEEPYKNAKLIYSGDGRIIALEMPDIKPRKSAKDYKVFPSF